MLTPFVYLAKMVFPRAKLLILFFGGVFISLVIEFSQLFIPGRVSDPIDFLANSLSVNLRKGFCKRNLHVFVNTRLSPKDYRFQG